MNYPDGPIETSTEPDGFEPLEWDDEVYEDEDDAYVYDDDPYEEEELEEPGLAGFDDLMPFGSFDSGFGWGD